MPRVTVQTNAGPQSFHYTISTPTNDNAEHLDKESLTILFLHPQYVASESFHPQFEDDMLRREFNMVAVDLRGFGETGGKPGDVYDVGCAAQDIARIIEKLGFPPLFVFGHSMGTMVALELAVTYPSLVRGVFMVSTVGVEETEHAAEGRAEISRYWAEGFKAGDMEAVKDAISGAMQFAFNTEKSGMITSIVTRTVPQLIHHWSNTTEEECWMYVVDFFKFRTDLRPSANAPLWRDIPIFIAHGEDDVAYPTSSARELANAIDFARSSSSERVQVEVIPHGPHFCAVTHWRLIDPLLRDFIFRHSKDSERTTGVTTRTYKSPFEAELVKTGLYSSVEDTDSDDELETI